MSEKQLVIIGAGEFGKMAYHYFTDCTDYKIVGFAVEQQYRETDILENLPVIDFEEISSVFPPNQVDVFVAITSVARNQARTRIFRACKAMGYYCASFIHPSAIIGYGVTIGENVFIMEQVSVQYCVQVGNNCVIWEGCVLSHSGKIGDNCWIAPGVTLAGFCNIGENCFLGVGSVYRDGIYIAADTMVGAGAVIVKDIKLPGGTYVGNPGRKL